MKQKASFPLLSMVLLNFLLFSVKLYIGIRTNSLCIYTDSINNLLDTLSALLSFFGMFLAVRGATAKHPFGFGRLEYLLEFLLSLSMTATGFAFFYNSLSRLLLPTPVWYYLRYAILLCLTCVIKLMLGIYFLRLYRRTALKLYKAFYLDSFLDCGITAATVLSFTLSNSLNAPIDAFFGLGISLCIVLSGIKLICSSVSALLGQADTALQHILAEQVQSINPAVQLLAADIHDYGTNAKAVSLRLHPTEAVNLPSFREALQTSLAAYNIIKLYIEWEA